MRFTLLGVLDLFSDDMAYVFSSESLRKSPGDLNVVTCCEIARELLGVKYYVSSRWPKPMQLFKVDIKTVTFSCDIKPKTTVVKVECTGIHGTRIQPEISWRALPQFLKARKRYLPMQL